MPDNPFQEELDRRSQNPFQAEIDERSSDPGGFHVFMESLRRNIGDMILATPSATGDALAFADAGVKGTLGGLIPGGRSFDYRNRFEEAQDKILMRALRSIPRYRTNQAEAALRSLPALLPGGQSVPERFNEILTEEDERQLREAELHPGAALAGDFAGSVASLLALKRPLAPTIRNVERRIAGRGAAEAASRLANIDSGMLRVVDRALQSQMVRRPIRGASRAAEPGLRRRSLRCSMTRRTIRYLPRPLQPAARSALLA